MPSGFTSRCRLGGDEHQARLQPGALFGLPHPQWGTPPEDKGQEARVVGGEVLHHHDSGAKVAGETREDGAQRRQPTGRGGHGNDIVRNPGERVRRSATGWIVTLTAPHACHSLPQSAASPRHPLAS